LKDSLHIVTRTWLALLHAASLLPFGWQLTIGKGLGNVLYLTARRRRRIAETNIRLCFPEKSPKERRRILKKNFQFMGQAIFEIAFTWWARDARLAGMAKFQGLEHLEGALKQGRGAILLSAHFTSLEIGGRLLATRIAFHGIYRPHKNKVFETAMKRGRERHIRKAIPRNDTRSILRSLKSGTPVWYAPDQNYGKEHSIFVPFFGIPASTITATSRLAKLSQAPVVPFFTRRLNNGQYCLHLLPPLEDFPSADIAADTLRINKLIENEIRLAPEQYLWAHRRFKTRPPSMTPVYD